MAQRDYYEVLGVSRGAPNDEIARAYRRMAKKHHPDRNRDDPAAEKRFKEIQEAYDILKDARKRSLYDQFGRDAAHGNWSSSGATGYTRATGPHGQEINLGDLEDLFSVFGEGTNRGQSGSPFDPFFGRSTGRRWGPGVGPAIPGQDIEHRVQLTFDQAVHGTELQLTLTPTDASGGRPERIDIRIPAGVEDGQKIRVRGKGGRGSRGGPPGNLYVICRVGPHPYFRRAGADVYLDVPLSLTEAALGATVEVPTVQGSASVRVPPGTKSGTKLRLRGRGIARSKGDGHGDHYAVIQIVPPSELTPRQRELLESLAAETESDPRASVDWARTPAGKGSR